MGFAGPHQEKAPEPREVPRQLQTRLQPPSSPKVFLPSHPHHPATWQVAVVGRAARSGCGGVPKRSRLQTVTFSTRATQHLLALARTSLMPGVESTSQTCSQLPELSLTLHLHFGSSHLSLIGPGSLLSLVPSSSRQMGMTPHCLGLYSTSMACKCFIFARGSLKVGSGEQQFTGAPEHEKFRVLLIINPQPTGTTSTVHWGRAGAMGSLEERVQAPASLRQVWACWNLGFTASAVHPTGGHRCLGS